jgi:hypothetical protein
MPELNVHLHAPSCRSTVFLERVLADWAPLTEVWPKTGESALLMAIRRRNVEVRDVLNTKCSYTTFLRLGPTGNGLDPQALNSRCCPSASLCTVSVQG